MCDKTVIDVRDLNFKDLQGKCVKWQMHYNKLNSTHKFLSLFIMDGIFIYLLPDRRLEVKFDKIQNWGL